MLEPIKNMADKPDLFTPMVRNARQVPRYAFEARDRLYQWAFVGAVLAIAIFWAWLEFR
jgi:hypothetical protein